MSKTTEDTSVQYFTGEDGVKYVSRHPSDPQHSLHQYHRLGGFLLVILILLIIGVVITIVAPFITIISNQAIIQMLSDPAYADLLPAGTIAEINRSMSIYSNPLYLITYILLVFVDIALIVIIFLRKSLYLQLIIASIAVTLVNNIISVTVIFAGFPGGEFTGAVSVGFTVVLGVLQLIYFLISKRVKIYFKGTREVRQIV